MKELVHSALIFLEMGKFMIHWVSTILSYDTERLIMTTQEQATHENVF